MSDNVKVSISLDPAVFAEVEREAKRKEQSNAATIESLIVTAVGRLAASRRYAKKTAAGAAPKAKKAAPKAKAPKGKPSVAKASKPKKPKAPKAAPAPAPVTPEDPPEAATPAF